MAIPKHCGADDTEAAALPAQRPNRSDRRAEPARQPPDTRAVDATERGDRDADATRQPAPAQYAQRRRPRMACRREGRPDECEPRTGTRGTAKLPPIMRRAGDEPAPDPRRPRPAPAAQVHASPQSRRQTHVARHHQHKPAATADARQIAAQRRPPGLAIMAQHHARKPLRQPRHSRPRVRQPPGVGEQPQRRHAAAPVFGTRPGQQSWVHPSSIPRPPARGRHRPRSAPVACFAIAGPILLQSLR